MEKFFNWFDNNKVYIGTLIGSIDIGLGLFYILQNNAVVATMWTGIGIVVLIDAWGNTDD